MFQLVLRMQMQSGKPTSSRDDKLPDSKSTLPDSDPAGAHANPNPEGKASIHSAAKWFCQLPNSCLRRARVSLNPGCLFPVQRQPPHIQ